ncbi:MAG: hypothetical protein ACPGYX_05060 [Oceanobacter sp.]
MEGLNYQQDSVLKYVSGARKSTLEHIQGMRKRATLVTAASTTIVGVISAANYLPKEFKSLDLSSGILLSLVTLLTVVMFFFTSEIWKTIDTPLVGHTDTDKLFDDYLAVDKDTAYNNFLIDECAALQMALDLNLKLANTFRKLIWAFQIQLALLALSIFTQADVDLSSIRTWLMC